MLPTAAKSYQTTQRREQQAALSALRREWRRMGPEFDASWALIVGSLLAITATAQRRVAEGATGFIPDVLEDTGQAAAIPATADVQAESLVGVTGSGRPVDEAFYVAVIASKIAIDQGMGVPSALRRGEERLMRAASLALSDTGRAAERLGMAVRPIGGYVRMLTPPSCSRCVLLAGRRYSSESAFQRHPRC